MRGRTVALVNGCFDVVHADHARLFAIAAAEADVVVVAIDTDERIRILKGSTRPVCWLSDRACVVGAMRYVAYVTSFDSVLALREIIAAIQPDVLVKGAEYAERDLPECDGAPSMRVVFSPHATDSTTAILRRLARE